MAFYSRWRQRRDDHRADVLIQRTFVIKRVSYQIRLNLADSRRLKSAATNLIIKDVAASFSLRYSETDQKNLVSQSKYGLQRGQGRDGSFQ